MIANVYFYEYSPDILETYWTKNDEKINHSKNNGKLSQMSNEHLSLTIRNVSPVDAGEYQLTAINAVGSSTSDIIVLGKVYFCYLFLKIFTLYLQRPVSLARCSCHSLTLYNGKTLVGLLC